MGAGAQQPVHESLGEVTAPTLVMIDELDVSFRPYADELVALMPHAELAVVPGAGHAAHTEAPGPASRVIRAFLTRT